MASDVEYIWVTLFSIIGIICIISNGLVCYVVVKKRALIGDLNYLILSLGLTDILFGALCVPVFVFLQTTYSPNMALGSTLNVSSQSENDSAIVHVASSRRWAVYICLNALEVYLSSCSILHLCTMALDRVILITKPIFHRGKWARKAVRLKLSMIPWLLSFITTTVTLIHHLLPDLLGNVVAILGVLILFPCTFLVVCYMIIFVSIRRHNRRFSSNRRRRRMSKEISHRFSFNDIKDYRSSVDDGLKHETNIHVAEAQPNLKKVRKINEMKMITTLLCIIMVFMVCWMPLLVISLVYPDYSTLKGLSSDFTTTLGTGAKFFYYCNSACNPFIYSFFNPAFRASVAGILRN